jgi:cobalt-precorrin-7 (C5)-methyltransferase
MIVVGVGCGPGMLTEEARREIAKARSVYGSRRALELVKGHVRKDAKVVTVDDYSGLSEIPEKAIVLSNGDPMLGGLGHMSRKVIPGISSMQVAYARIGAPMENTVIINAQGKYRDMAMRNAADEVARARNTFLLVDPKFDINAFARLLEVRNTDCMIAVCERLGYPDERIEIGTAMNPPSSRTDLFVVVAGAW